MPHDPVACGMSLPSTPSSPAASAATSMRRWWVLALAALAVSSSYYESDAIGPIADLLHRQLGFTQSQLGTLNGIINVPSVVLALINGLLMDRHGPARIALWSAALGVAGALLTAGAGSYEMMVAGRFIFGASEGTIFIALIAVLARWFSPSGIALATALYLSLARVGSYSVDTSPSWARALYDGGWRPPLWLGAGLTVAGFVAVLLLYGLDRKHVPPRIRVMPAAESRLDPSDLVQFDRSYWYILALHVLYAAVFFPFRTTYAIEYFQHAKGLTLQAAGLANSWVFFAAIFATPLFGLLADRFGHRALMLVLGTLLLPVTFVVLGLTEQGLWVSTVLMGVSFALVPAIIWPATTLIVEPRRLGTALGLITVVQALGIFASNRLAGFISDRAHAGAEHPAGYDAMLWFFGLLSLVALTSAVLLWSRESGPHGHGLERARRSTAHLPGSAAA
jgi:MFS family permease